MTALEYLKQFPYLHSREGDKLHRPSVSELKRWLMKGSVVINYRRPEPREEIEFPIRQLILHPASKQRCTIFDEDCNYE